ncbi:FecCD family ABC transporter permease [Streptomyces griseocarneus]|uniref:FecCD family ABC transporter permease n=1 Tax=Streptomyces griseocarneus TaxID=51201 RepID=UPI0035568E6B
MTDAPPDRASRSAAGRPATTRRTLLLVGGAALLVACAALSLAAGSRSVPLATVWHALTDGDQSRDGLVVTGLRVPRTVIGVVIGAALGVAGAVAQGVTRNPLASPATLGINHGAGFAVVVASYALHLTHPAQYLPFAFAGAALATLAVLALARRAGDLDPVRLALGGTVLDAVLISWTSAVMLTSHRTLDEARFWLAGSLAGRQTGILLPVAVPLAVGLLLALAIAPALNALALGDETAQALGVPVARIRAAGGVAVILLAASSVAVAGPLSFVGLAAPHLVRKAVGADHRWLLPGCLVAGPLLLLTADILGRVVLRPVELEVGIVTALLGAPMLAFLARKVAR